MREKGSERVSDVVRNSMQRQRREGGRGEEEGEGEGERGGNGREG